MAGNDFGQTGFNNRVAKPLNVSRGGVDYLAVADTNVHYPQGCKPNRVCRVYNSGAAQTNAIQIYDSATPDNPQSSELIFTITLGAAGTATGVADLDFPLQKGLAVQMAGALTGSTSVFVTWA